MASKQDELRAQIAALEKQIALEDAQEDRKRKANTGVLVAASPSPTKKRRVSEKQHQSATQGRPRLAAPSFGSSSTHRPAKAAPALGAQDDIFVAPKPSNMATSLASFNSVAESSVDKGSSEGNTSVGVTRNDDLTICEDLEVGPYTFAAPPGDPLFNTVEPHSQINLKSRSMSHEDVEEFMRGRYYVSPSTLYSIARLLPGGVGYEVPLVGDWVTIAVIGERGEISVSKGTSRDDGHDSDSEDNDKKKTQDKEPSLKDLASVSDTSNVPPKKKQPFRKKKTAESSSLDSNKGPKKYLTLRLVDFGNRATDSHTGKVAIRGDALLNMILFEANSWSQALTDDGREQRVYKGGSGGAFEACANLRAGCVIGIMNPKLLKPYQRGGGQPHPTDNVLGMTPENAQSIIVIGQSKDLGHCPAIKRDGKPCGSWCDKRVHNVCEFHIQRAVQSRKNARPEFATSTAGMSFTSKPPVGSTNRGGASQAGSSSSSKDFDSSRKWGLLPKAGAQPAATRTSMALGGGTTYVLPGSGVVARTGGGSNGGGITSDAQEKRKRLAARAEDARTMHVLRAKAGVEEDEPSISSSSRGAGGLLGMGLSAKGGGSSTLAAKSVVLARQALEEAQAREATKASSKGKGKSKSKDGTKSSASSEALASKLAAEKTKSLSSTGGDVHRVFSANAIKKIGFDPRAKAGEKHPDSDRISKVIANLQHEKTSFELGHDPKLKRSRLAPSHSKTGSSSTTTTKPVTVLLSADGQEEGDSDEDDLEIV